MSQSDKDEELQTAPKPTPAATPAPPPDGGLVAWSQVLGAFFLFMTSWGILNTFGVFQAFYETNYLTSSTPSAISWIGTIQGFLLIIVGVFSGPIYDLGYLKTLIFTGAVLSVLGLMTASVARQYYSVFLSLGVTVGLGSGCLFVPSVAIVATYFSKKRPFATGITASGGSLGGVIFPIVFRRLIDEIGFGWACRVLGFMVGGVLCISFVVMKPRSIAGTKRRLFDLAAFKDPTFFLFSISIFIIYVGLYVPFFYVSTYVEQKLGTSPQLAFYLLSIMNAGSVFGRLIPNLLAVYWGSLEVLLGCIGASGVLAFVWIGIHNFPGIVVFCILYGFFSGGVVSLPPSALVAISPDLSVIGTRMGNCFSFASFGLLIGSPIAGAILTGPSEFVGQGVFAGVTIIVGFALMIVALVLHRRKSKQVSQP